MIEARHHFIIYPFFKLYTLYLLRKHFRHVSIRGEFIDKGLPVLIIANHFSWWDGFWINYLNIKLIKRKYHFMMLEEQLQKNRILNYTGGYSIRKNSRSIIQTLAYTSKLLTNSKNLVLMFPQGKIESIYADNFTFETGLLHILKRLQNNIHLLFVANMVDYVSYAKPAVDIYIAEYKGNKEFLDELQQSYRIFYEQCRANQINKAV